MNPNNDQYGSYAVPNPSSNDQSAPQMPAPSWQPPAPEPTVPPHYVAPVPPEWQPPQPPVSTPPSMPHPAPPAAAPNHSPLHPMIVMQEGEKVVDRIKRHPIGIIGSYIGGAFVVLLAAAAVVFLVPHLTENLSDPSTVRTASYGALALVAIGTTALLSIASKVYWGNEWVITSDSITQTLQVSLFSQQTAQLSMENLEDVTVDQNGILQHMFNFGTLHVETAGEHSKFVFPFCPSPTAYARRIIEAHEAFINNKQYEQQ